MGEITAGKHNRVFTHPAKSVPLVGGASPYTIGSRHLINHAPVEGETNFMNQSNPTLHIRIKPQMSGQGNLFASSTMAASMKPSFNGAANFAAQKPLYTNTNAAPPWLSTYGPATRAGNAGPAETSVFAMGGGGPAILRSRAKQKNRAVVKLG